MLDRRPQLGSQTGQTAAEAMGVLLLVSLGLPTCGSASPTHRARGPDFRQDLGGWSAKRRPKGGVGRITRQAYVLPPENAAEIVLKHCNELL
jgi:hypothetical protein